MQTPFKAILFDLDGTLLDVNIDVFIPHYVDALATSVAHVVPRDRFIPSLMRATEAMMGNHGDDTNDIVFARVFYPAVGHAREELEPIFQSFYAHEYPRLRCFTRRKPDARLAVQAAIDRGCDVVIATNPLFPLVAIEQRLEWAGVADFAYRRVTTYENSLATKPNLLYFTQVLDAIGYPGEDCLMVGDEDIDMVAAHLGCTTFLVPSARTDLSASTPEPSYRGTLDDLITLLQDSA